MLEIFHGLVFENITNLQNFSAVKKIIEEEQRRLMVCTGWSPILKEEEWVRRYYKELSEDEWIRRNVCEDGGYLEKKTYRISLWNMYAMLPEKIEKCEKLLGCKAVVHSPYHGYFKDYRKIYESPYDEEITALLREHGFSDFFISSTEVEQIVAYFGKEGLKRGWGVVPPRLLSDRTGYFYGLFPECGVVAKLTEDGQLIIPEDLFEREYDVPFLEGKFPKKLFVRFKEILDDDYPFPDIDESEYSEEVFFGRFDEWKKRRTGDEDEPELPAWQLGLKERYEKAFGKIAHSIWGVVDPDKYTEEERKYLEEHFEEWKNIFWGIYSDQIIKYLDHNFIGFEVIKAIIEEKL